MTGIELLLYCFLVPLLMALMYIAGKHDMIKLIGNMIKDLEDRKRNVTSIAYICDGKACKKCNKDFCYHTNDIHHAKNFTEFVPGKFFENFVMPKLDAKGDEDNNNG